MAGENDINIRIESIDRGGSSQPNAGPTASSGGGGQPTGSSGQRSQPTPADFAGSFGSRSEGGGSGPERLGDSDLRDLFGKGEQASGMEQLLQSFRLTRGFGDILKKVRDARNKEAFAGFKSEYRSYERARDKYAAEQEEAAAASTPVLPPEFRPNGQNFIPSVEQPAPGSAPPLPPGSPPQPPPFNGPGASGTPPTPSGGQGGSGGPPTPPVAPASAAGGFFPNLGASGNAAMAGAVAAGVGLAIGAGIAVIGKGVELAVAGIRALIDEYKRSTQEVAPFSAPVLESLVNEQLQRLADIQHRGQYAGEQIAEVNDELVTLNSEFYRLVTELLHTFGPQVVELLQTISFTLNAFRQGFENYGENQEKLAGNLHTRAKNIDETLQKWNDIERDRERVAILHDLLFRPVGLDPDVPAPAGPPLPLFPAIPAPPADPAS